MRVLDHIDVLQETAKSLKKPVMYISFDYNIGLCELIKAAPYLVDLSIFGQVLCDCSGYIVFDDEDEMYRYYNKTVGDDGPNSANPYTGPARVYAITCDACGQLGTENT